MPLLNLVSLCCALTTEAAHDRIESLPGFDEPIKFNQYAGYLPLHHNSTKHIFYWFVEAQSHPLDAPVVFWTNGGPGCSGFIALFSEHGPFIAEAEGKLRRNPHSWNLNANMLYVEQPVGVGFSFSKDPNDLVSDDDLAAYDNFHFIQQFFLRFPEFSGNDFYISSESYGGHYIPTLAKFIVENNPTGALNFKGFIILSAFTNIVEGAIGMYDTLYGHQVVSKPTHDLWTQFCRDDDVSEKCVNIEQKLLQESGNLDQYAIDYPVCLDGVRSIGRGQRHRLFRHISRKKVRLGLIPPTDYQPCIESFFTDYLNRKDVKSAIHAKEHIEWADCSDSLQYSDADNYNDMVPIYKWLLQNHPELRMFLVSGDDDTICGTLGTQSWIWNVSDINTQWAPWTYNDPVFGNQIGGYLVKFKGISFATVHGAGHEVPLYKPIPALKLFQEFLNGEIF